MRILGKKIIIILFVSMLLSMLNSFNSASAWSGNVKITSVFQKDVDTRISSLYKKNPKTLNQTDAKNLNYLLNLDRKLLLHALAESAPSSKASETSAIDFFSKYLMKNFILFMNETEPQAKSNSPKSQAAYRIIVSVANVEQLPLLGKEMEVNKNFIVRSTILDLFRDKYGKAAIDFITKIIPTEPNIGVRAKTISLAFDLGDTYPDLLPVICKPYIKVGGTTAKNVYINLLSMISNEQRKTNWVEYLIFNQDDPSAAKLWSDLQSKSYDFQYFQLLDRFKNNPTVFKRLEEMDPKTAEIWKKAQLQL
ncbi:hypothetical protein [Paenibacillus sp. 22594]|uniref:hypothetical protein n=1 Tax=Paenibacillus sp. 22594 TaxID=3453947 RepID=UPI003F834689